MKAISPYAFVVSSGGIVDRRAVKVGGTDGDRLEVLAGLSAGERVVLSPPAELASGAQVTVAEGLQVEESLRIRRTKNDERRTATWRIPFQYLVLVSGLSPSSGLLRCNA